MKKDARMFMRDGETVRPLGRTGWNNVLVRRDNHQKVTASGIVLPGDGKQATTATVVEVGIGKFRSNGKPIPTQVKAGDRVLIGESGGYSVWKEDGTKTDLFILRESPDVNEILAVLED